jgi:F0F1-type ATP synthase assembly protein I
MRLPPIPSKVRTDRAIGQGMDVALTVLLFFGIGFALDRWLGTTPWLMIGGTLFASIGLFVSSKARYDATMERLEAERAERTERARQ